MIYNKILVDFIEKEKSGADFWYSDADRVSLKKMLREVNSILGTNFQYLAEFAAFDIRGAGPIVARYIDQFESESVRGYILPQMVSDKVQDCDKIVLRLYHHFKASDSYISTPGRPSSAHIHVRYDDSFKRLKPRRLQHELMELVCNPRDAFYLPFTVRMLASWRTPGMQELLLSYLDGKSVTGQAIGLYEKTENVDSLIEGIKRELTFTAIEGLKHFPTADTLLTLKRYVDSPDRDIRSAAMKTIKVFQKKSPL